MKDLVSGVWPWVNENEEGENVFCVVVEIVTVTVNDVDLARGGVLGSSVTVFSLD